MYEIFEELLTKKGARAADVAKATGIYATVFSEWKKGKSSPKADKLQKIADYFGVTIEYLMSGKERQSEKETILTPKDEKDIAKDLAAIREKLTNKEDGPASFDGENISDDSAELLLAQMESMLRTIKVLNKEKYNPYKNKNKK